MIAPSPRAAGGAPLGTGRWRAREVAEGEAAGALAALVAAIGAGDFPARFLEVMRVLAGVELCSVFRRDAGAEVRLLFVAGTPSDRPDFALRASLDYARGYWRADSQLTRLARAGEGAPLVVRRHVSEIADPAYRAACYERADVVERVSILWPGRPGLVANGYRTAPGARFAPHELERLETHAGILLAALRHHLRAEGEGGHLLSEAGLAERLAALDHGLSIREAEIAAALILGATQDEIAAARGLSPSTVITYRRRAYAKLGVANRRELVALHRRMIADPNPR